MLPRMSGFLHFFHFSCSKNVGKVHIVSQNDVFFLLIDLGKYYVKNNLRRNIHASHPNRYLQFCFQFQSVFVSDTAWSYVRITRV